MNPAVVVLVAVLAVGTADQTVISLNGDNWILSDSSGRVKGLQATVPGQAHTDLQYVCSYIAAKSTRLSSSIPVHFTF